MGTKYKMKIRPDLIKWSLGVLFSIAGLIVIIFGIVEHETIFNIPSLFGICIYLFGFITMNESEVNKLEAELKELKEEKC